MYAWGVPQKPGRSFHLRHIPATGSRVTNLPTNRWYLRASESEPGGKGGRESECLHSTDEAGELFLGGPRGGKAGIRSRNRWRER
jgi:hypothetical protein